MQLTTERRELTTHGLTEVSRARIRASAKVFDMFENHYSDKFKAIVRELTSNAIDAHRQAGNLEPIKVYLPDEFDPYFRVVDHGIGMSHAFCMNEFMEYSNGSTKSGSNEAIGGFGIGSKSPFAYTDQFTLRSVHDGVCTVYSVFKDEEGLPCIAPLQQTQTDEVNGVEFSVPVEPSDFAKFHNAATTHLVYFEDEVQLFGATITPLNYVQKGAGWGIRQRDKYDSKARVVMGGVAYPVEFYQLSSDIRNDETISPLADMPVDLYLPIGACDIAPNREALLYSDKTSASIEQFLRDIVSEVTADMPTMFDHLDSRWEAAFALTEYVGNDFHTPWSKLVMQHVLYRGDELKAEVQTLPGSYEHWEIGRRESNRRNHYRPKCPNARWGYGHTKLRPYNIAHIIIDDLPQKDAPVKRIKTYVEEDCDYDDIVLVIRALDDPLDKVLEAFGNPSADRIIYTSDLPAPPKQTRAKSHSSGPRPRVRMFQAPYNFDPHKTSMRTDLYEIAYADQPDDGILLVCDNFELPAINFWQKNYTDLIARHEYHIVNKGDAARLDMSKWTLWQDEFDKRLAQYLRDHPTAPQYKALMTSSLSDLFAFIKLNPALFKHVTKSKPLGKLVQLVETYDCEPLGAIEKFVEPQLPPRLNPDDLLARIERDNWQFMTLYTVACSRRHIDTDSALFRLLKENI